MEPILSVTEIYVEKELDNDARVRFQTMIFPNHVAGRARRFDVVRLDLRRGRMEVIGRELPLVHARQIATEHDCETPAEYLDEHCDGFERGHTDHNCALNRCDDGSNDPTHCASCGKELSVFGTCDRQCADQAWLMAKHEEVCKSADIECDECGDSLDTEGNCDNCAEYRARLNSHGDCR